MNNQNHAMPGLTILSISRRAGMNTLSLSDGSELSLPHSLFLKCPWRTGSAISPDAFHAWVAENEYSSALERAGHSLSAKNRSEKEMKETLLRAGYSELCTLRVIDRLRKLGYLDDSVYASSFARQRSSLGYGENRIRQELRMKGIPEEEVQAAIGELSGDVQNERIRKAAEKAARGKDLSSFKDRQRVKAALARRGFDFESIDAVLTEMAGAMDEDYE
ncbi:MAG: regulatory protein RecX [Clostridia bacterium]|nr:regulatory protein RecX [Clostridia bacterium]